MRAICIANMKGGVGKTVTAVHLAVGLGRRGQRILLVDMDPQANATFLFGVNARFTIRHLIAGDAAPAACVSTTTAGVDLIASETAAFTLETQMSGTIQRETLLARRLAALAYDAIVIDTSPAMGLLTYNALLAATEVILPVTMDPLGVLGVRETLHGIREIRALWHDHPLAVTAVLPTNVHTSRLATTAAMAALESDPETASALLKPGIRQCAEVVHAIAARETVWTYAPRSRAAGEYDRFVDRIAAGAQSGGDHGLEETARLV